MTVLEVYSFARIAHRLEHTKIPHISTAAYYCIRAHRTRSCSWWTWNCSIGGFIQVRPRLAVTDPLSPTVHPTGESTPGSARVWLKVRRIDAVLRP